MRTLDPSSAKTLDPYSPEALARLTLTNLRIRLLKAQTCPAPVHPEPEHTSPHKASALTSTSASESPPSAPFAIYTLLARGTCLCHGHAEYCFPHNASQDGNVVGGFFHLSVKGKTIRQPVSVTPCFRLCFMTAFFPETCQDVGSTCECT